MNSKISTIQTTGLKRKTTDKYYTAPNVVETCMKLFKEHVSIQPNDLCIEPSAGNGAFINTIKSNFNHFKFYDIDPEHSEAIKQDYLTYDYTKISSTFKKIHVIGNPPFGRQSSLAIKFIKRSAMYCDSISFILPKSFKKESLKKHFPLHFHLVHENDLPSYAFIVDCNAYDVPCVFQIWIKKETERVVPKKLFPEKFCFVKKMEDHDISFRRVGVYAGEIAKNTQEKSTQSHYFIKFKMALTNEMFETLSNIKYESKNNTCGPKSISKQELIKEFNMVL